MNPDLGQTVPGQAEFVHVAASGVPVMSVVRRVLADGMTPVAIYQALAGGTVGSFLLESAQVDGTWTRYSIMGITARATLTQDEGRAVWLGTAPAGAPTEGTLLDVAAATLELLRDAPTPACPGSPHALVGALGFDLIHQWEHLPRQAVDDTRLPVGHLVLSDEMAVVDHRDGSLYLVANVWEPSREPGLAREQWHAAVSRLDALCAALGGAPALAPVTFAGPDLAAVSARTSREDYLDQVRAVQRAIVDGEVFQTVVAQRFEVPCPADPLDVYRVLRATNPSPYMYLLRCAGPDGQRFDVVGSSPEALVRVEQGLVTSHPIAGTRPRSGDERVDAAAVEELVRDEKELAEHVMLVDLARNDLSRVCEPGSVQVPQYLTVQYFSHVIHLESTVTGTLAPSVGPVDVVRATFPAGTLSGAPKLRAIELIDELEPVRRGFYGGCVGYLDPSGDLDLAIAIRTAVVARGTAHVYAGAGVVADSDPESEYAECGAKSAAALRAVAAAATLRTY